MSREERNYYFELVANRSENSIYNQVGEDGKDLIMDWWYKMCSVREKERIFEKGENYVN